MDINIQNIYKNIETVDTANPFDKKPDSFGIKKYSDVAMNFIPAPIPLDGWAGDAVAVDELEDEVELEIMDDFEFDEDEALEA